VPAPGRHPAGCRFHPRCPHAEPGRCDQHPPELVDQGGHADRCLRSEELVLPGVLAR